MKQILMRHFIALMLLTESLLAVAQVDDTHTQQDHAEHMPAEAMHEHEAEPARDDADIDHSQHGSHTATVTHDHHEPQPSADGAAHQHMPAPMAHEAMADAMVQSTDSSALRDPHAYSNGFQLTSGPYLQASARRVRLADETTFTGLWVDRFEYVDSHDFDATEFEGHVWMGDSYNRFLLRSEIELLDDAIETAELDFLHTRAISPFWNIQYGLRREFGEDDERNWASIGLSGLAPYWFEVDASLFFGENGNTLLDIEAEYDLLLTQRLVMQPRIDVHSYSKDDAEMGRGSGLSVVKTGFRLRYEFDRQIAPYLGYERVVKYGETADLLPAGEDRTDNHWIIGFKFWF